MQRWIWLLVDARLLANVAFVIFRKIPEFHFRLRSNNKNRPHRTRKVSKPSKSCFASFACYTTPLSTPDHDVQDSCTNWRPSDGQSVIKSVSEDCEAQPFGIYFIENKPWISKVFWSFFFLGRICKKCRFYLHFMTYILKQFTDNPFVRFCIWNTTLQWISSVPLYKFLAVCEMKSLTLDC